MEKLGAAAVVTAALAPSGTIKVLEPLVSFFWEDLALDVTASFHRTYWRIIAGIIAFPKQNLIDKYLINPKDCYDDIFSGAIKVMLIFCDDNMLR